MKNLAGRDILRFLAGPVIPFLVLPGLMVALIAGTIAQRFIGLYESQRQFFSSIVMWVGPVPLPGALTLSIILTVALIVKFIAFSPWRIEKAGINLAHLGVLVLLIGGTITALKSHEGYMTIPEGESSQTVLDFRQRELVILNDGKVMQRIGHESLSPGQVIAMKDPDFKITVRSICNHCAINKVQDPAPSNQGMARFMVLSEGKPAANDDENLSGITMDIDGIAKDQDGMWLTFDPMPKPMIFKKAGHEIEIVYGRVQRSLPFSVALKNFTRTSYPGTDKPKSYSSDVIINDGGMTWPVTIEMNKPFRYRGYTLFQSSFSQKPGKSDETILMVVKNAGWPFPYIGSALMGIGLLLHMALSFAKKRAG